MLFYWILAVLILLAFLFLLTCYICYRIAFSVPKRCKTDPYSLPDDDQYRELRQQIHQLVENIRQFPCEEVAVLSVDGLRLHGQYYEQTPGAPVQILFHGYRSSPLRDFSGGLPLALQSGCNVLLVDQRAHGKSEGKHLTFGVMERLDCLTWIDYVCNRDGNDIPIVLTGLSMGASTVLMASELELPCNVKGIIADCGYSSPKAIIRKVIHDMRYPLELTYFFVRLGGKLFGRFDIEAASAVDALKYAKVPVLFIHGDDDRFVPCTMSEENYAACCAQKHMLRVAGAGHGLSYMVDAEGYRSSIQNFLKDIDVLKVMPNSKRDER